jgi:hypothetical protein
MRRNAARICLEKMVADQETIPEYLDEKEDICFKKKDQEYNDVLVKEKKSGCTFTSSTNKVTGKTEVDSTDEEVTLNRYRKPRAKSRLIKNISIERKYDSSAGDSSDSERRRMSKRNASLNASVIISLSSYGVAKVTISISRLLE